MEAAVVSEIRILVTGSRLITPGADERLIVSVLDELYEQVAARRRIAIVHGGACGVDMVAAFWATGSGVLQERHDADWDEYGKAAGPRRNREMVDAGAHLCVAFPRRSSIGTWDCIRQAANAGIPVRIYPLTEA